jgi:hypothetical protein
LLSSFPARAPLHFFAGTLDRRFAAALDGQSGEQEGGRVPALASHAFRLQRRSVEPFGESPIVEPVEPSQLQEFGARQLRFADVHQRQDQKALMSGQMPPL